MCSKNERFTDKIVTPEITRISGVFSFGNPFGNLCSEKVGFTNAPYHIYQNILYSAREIDTSPPKLLMVNLLSSRMVSFSILYSNGNRYIDELISENV